MVIVGVGAQDRTGSAHRGRRAGNARGRADDVALPSATLEKLTVAVSLASSMTIPVAGRRSEAPPAFAASLALSPAFSTSVNASSDVGDLFADVMTDSCLAAVSHRR